MELLALRSSLEQAFRSATAGFAPCAGSGEVLEEWSDSRAVSKVDDLNFSYEVSSCTCGHCSEFMEALFSGYEEELRENYYADLRGY